MVRTRRTRHNSSSVSADRLIRLWLLRLLVPLGAHREFIGPNGMHNNTLAEAIGLAHWIDPGSPDFDASLVRAELRQLHARADRPKTGTTQMTLGRRHDLRCLRVLLPGPLESTFTLRQEREQLHRSIGPGGDLHVNAAVEVVQIGPVISGRRY